MANGRGRVPWRRRATAATAATAATVATAASAAHSKALISRFVRPRNTKATHNKSAGQKLRGGGNNDGLGGGMTVGRVFHLASYPRSPGPACARMSRRRE